MKLKMALAVATALTTSAAFASVTDQDILNDHKTTDQVVTYGMGTKAQRFSPLDAVNTDTAISDAVWSFSRMKNHGQEFRRW